MAQITIDPGAVDHDATTVHAPSAARARSVLAEDEEHSRERLRSTVAVAISVALLLGLLAAGGLWLRDVLDFGVWFLSER